MIKVLRGATAVLGIVIVSAAWGHDNHDHSQVTGLVRERMDAMAEMGQRMKSITKQLRAKDKLASVQDDAKVIKDLAANIIPLFPQGSLKAPSEAAPAIWRDFGDFESKAKALEREAGKLSDMNMPDPPALAQQAAAVADACSGCHERYRIKQ